MNVPGAGLLGMALGLIAGQSVQHRAFLSRTVNGVGDFVSTFAAPVPIVASFQPIDTKLKQQLGLNLASSYAYLFTAANVQPTQEGREGDLIIYGGRTWQAEDKHEWSLVNEVGGVLLVEVPAHE